MRRRTPYLKSGALSEETIQRTVAGFLRVALPEGCGVMWAHFPMGGKRPRGEAGKLKAMGARPGILDLYFRWPGHVGWIELKSEEGALSGEQKAFIAEATALGDLCAVLASVEAVEGTLRGWLPPGTLRATLLPGGGHRIQDRATPARDVPPGERWAFDRHLTLAEAGSGC